MPEKGSPVQSRRPPPEAEAIELAILYEDEWLIAVDKPAGMVVHPTYKNWSGTLLNALLWHVRDRSAAPGPNRLRQGYGGSPKLYAEAEGSVQPRIVTRLDKDTSGIVLAALTSDVHARIQRDTHARRVRKEYLAIVHGRPAPPRGSIVLPLARDKEDRRRVVVDANGQQCETRYEVLDPDRSHSEFSIVRCELVTGRTHQIRVHLASRGWPVVGDRVYGTPHNELVRHALHAWRVTLPHPVSREQLALEAPVATELRPWMPRVF